ncbi:MAG: hypothetical protein JRJ68_12070 [Deltaproteobacteria bacterium]|nr:hypothetical protein [Deltaproteobacteria bacterium]
MRKYHIIGLSISVILLLGTFSAAADLRDGFMTYKWGTDISRYGELKKLYSKKDISYYSNPGESYTIDDISIDNVIFGFYNDSLFAVYITIDSLEIYDRVKLHMKLKYGLPDTKTSTKDYLTALKWKYQDVTIKLKTEEIEGKMKLAFYYRPLSKKLNKEQLGTIDESSLRFFPIDKTKTPRLVPFLEF